MADFEQAKEFFLKSLVLNQELDRKDGIAKVRGSLGRICESLGNQDLACKHWREAVRLFQLIGSPHQVVKHLGWMREAGCPDIPADE